MEIAFSVKVFKKKNDSNRIGHGSLRIRRFQSGRLPPNVLRFNDDTACQQKTT